MKTIQTKIKVKTEIGSIYDVTVEIVKEDKTFDYTITNIETKSSIYDEISKEEREYIEASIDKAVYNTMINKVIEEINEDLKI